MTSHQLHSTERPTPASVALPPVTLVTFYATMTRGHGHGSIGPCIVEIKRHDFETCYRSTYSVHIDGRHAFGGFADHLPTDPMQLQASWLINRVDADALPTVALDDDDKTFEPLSEDDERMLTAYETGRELIGQRVVVKTVDAVTITGVLASVHDDRICISGRTLRPIALRFVSSIKATKAVTR